MGTVILLTLMASSIALSFYLMWKAFSVLPKHSISEQRQSAPLVPEPTAASSMPEAASAKP